jgi:hypothetical protein
MARSFVGTSSQYVDCGRVQALEGVTYATMSAWLWRSATNKIVCLGKNPDSVTYPSFYISLYNDGALYVGNRSDASNGYGSLATTITGWNHFALVFDGSQATNATRLKLYLNGVLKTINYGGTVISTIACTSSSTMRIGRAGSNYSTGSIANARLYLSSLTIGQVVSDMCGFLPVAPLGNWPLGMSSPEVDFSGNGYAGTLVNAPAIADGPPVGIYPYEDDFLSGISQSNAPRYYYRQQMMKAA